MYIKKINKFNLKTLENTPIRKERLDTEIPFAVVNEQMEYLLGSDSCVETDENGDVECLVLEGLDNMKSRQVSFLLHYIGMGAVVDYKNFNSMKSPSPSLDGLFLWDARQFEECACREQKMVCTNNENNLF